MRFSTRSPFPWPGGDVVSPGGGRAGALSPAPTHSGPAPTARFCAGGADLAGFSVSAQLGMSYFRRSLRFGRFLKDGSHERS